MTTINDNILKLADQACLKISADNKALSIRQKFLFKDKSTLGLGFFLLAGLFIIVAAFFKTSDTASKIIGIVVGVVLLIFSILTLARQFADGLKVNNNVLTFRHNLKRIIIPFNNSMAVKMKTEVIKIRRVGTIGSNFIIVTHFLQDQNTETPILKFQMSEANADNAKKLGIELTRIINSRFRNKSEAYS